MIKTGMLNVFFLNKKKLIINIILKIFYTLYFPKRISNTWEILNDSKKFIIIKISIY